MKSQFYPFLLFLLLLTSTSFGQGWIEIYSPAVGPATLAEIAATQDGGYIMVGTESYPTGAIRDYIRLVKTDQDGVKQWEKVYGAGQVNFDTGMSVEQTPDGGYLIGGRGIGNNGNSGTNIQIMRVDAQGDSVWVKQYFHAGNDDGAIVRQTFDGNIMVLGSIENNILGIPTSLHDYQLIKTDMQGDTLWTKWYPTASDDRINDFIQLPDSGFVSVGSSSNTWLVMRFNEIGDTLWTYKGTFPGRARGVDYLPNGQIVVTGIIEGITTSTVTMTFDTDGTLLDTDYPTLIKEAYDIVVLPNGDRITVGVDANFPARPLMVKTDINDTLIWQRNLSISPFGSWMKNVIVTANGNIVVGGNVGGSYFLALFDSNGIAFSNQVTGNIFNDANQNCTYDVGEDSLKQWMVTLNDGNTVYYALTDSSGNYTFQVDTGNYTLNVITPNSYWQPCAIPNIQFTTFYDTIITNIGIKPIVSCPAMQVDISTPFLRRCFDNTYTVNYCNKGTLTAPNATIEVEIDSFLIINNTSIPWTVQNGNTYTFPIGNIGIGQCGSFTINVTVDCTAQLGQTHCVTAHAYPDTVCTLPTNWSGVNIEVEAECLGDTIEFKIQNTGVADMLQSKMYTVIEDHVILRQGTFQLISGDSALVLIPTDGSTYRLLAGQAANHPYSTQPTVALEGCTTMPPFLTGFFTAFANDDGATFLATDCQENIGAFDPNDKRGFPKGNNNEHYILKNTDLNYHIRFQNTGTDTAFTVVIRDTIDTQTLDLSKIEFGTSSHPYLVDIVDGHTLKFTFNNIMLPDSNVNEPASHGFVKFRIPQQADLPNGTLIENSAAIYFDFNEPVITNVAYHTIGQTLVNTEPIQNYDGLAVKIFPNPFINQTTFQLEDREQRDLELQIFDAMGRIVHQEQFYNTHQFTFYNSKLTHGIYFYTLTSEGRLINRGKMMVGE